jgi:hypothetical protein
MITTPASIDKIQELLLTGNIAQFTPAERVQYLVKVCDSLGLNPLTRPIEFMQLNGKLVPYVKRDGTDQLRKINGVSIRITKQEVVGDILFVTTEATDKHGRTDSDVGAINISGLKGEALANATMKAVTKAKRRVTLSICGLGFLDESEIESVQAPHVDLPAITTAPTEETFKNIRALLEAKKKSEEGLVTYLNTQTSSNISKLEEMNSAQVEYAYRILGGAK